MLKALMVAGIAVGMTLGIVSGASAVTVNVLGQSNQGQFNDAGIGYAVGYGTYVPVGAAFDDDPTVIPPPGNKGGAYESPFNSNPLTNAQSYFAVGGVNGANGALSPVTLTFSKAQSEFNILWGSIDRYNTLSFLDQMGNAIAGASYTGTAIETYLTHTGTGPNYENVALLNFDFGSALFYGVKFLSTRAAFEFALAPVPLPGSSLLLVTAVGGLLAVGFVRKMRRSTKASLVA